MSTLLTFVLPMYNVEKFIERCLESIYSQKGVSTDRFDVVLVDDGSPDRSARIAEEWLASRNITNALIVRQENLGLGGARNTGLDHVKTPFVWFVDTDDYIPDDALSSILPLLTDDVDLLTFYSADVAGDDPVDAVTIAPYEALPERLTGPELLQCIDLRPCPPLAVIRKSILDENGIRFVPRLFHEDFEMTPRLLHFVKGVRILKEAKYFTRFNPDSITRSVNYKKNFDLIKVANSLDVFSNRRDLTDAERTAYSSFISIALNSALLDSAAMPDAVRSELGEKLYENRRLLRHFRKSALSKHRVEGLLFSLSPRKIIPIYNLLAKLV